MRLDRCCQAMTTLRRKHSLQRSSERLLASLLRRVAAAAASSLPQLSPAPGRRANSTRHTLLQEEGQPRSDRQTMRAMLGLREKHNGLTGVRPLQACLLDHLDNHAGG